MDGKKRKKRQEESDDDDNGIVVCDGGGQDNDSSDNHQSRVETRSLKEIVTSLSLEVKAKSNGDEEEMLEVNRKRKTKSLLELHSLFQDHCGDSDFLEGSQKRKSRVNAVSTAMGSANEVNKRRKSGGGKGGAGGGTQKRLWVKNRDTSWWDQCNSDEFPDEEFRRAFRMGKDTFEMICSELNSAVAKENTMLRDAVPVRQRVAVCIWRLATGKPLRDVSRKFGLGISTCHKLVLEVCLAIWTIFMPKYLQWPHGHSLNKIKDEFGSMSDIPNVVGSMHTTHVPIIAPKNTVSAYINKRQTDRNQKTSYSITVQGVVDSTGLFTDVCIGWPGSMPDDQILERSTLYQRASGGLLNDVWIVGSSGFPLMDWVLVPYTQAHLTWTQHAFNEKITEVQRVSRDAFARLKGRWCCLQKRTEVKLQDLPTVLGACCILHNICEMRNEEMDPELKYELVDDEMIPQNALRSVRARKARDSIAHNLLHRNHAGTSFLS